jgi:error-prone DNA polymerase
MSAIRLKCTLAEAGRKLLPNGERYLRTIGRISGICPPRLLAATLDLASRCRFSLDEIRYEYPEELVPAGETPATHLRKLTYEGLARRYPDGAPESVVKTVEHELALIRDMKYEPFFLTVQDIVAFARSQEILCQGRGSAANSAVCYCLGITEVDPGRMSVLFERFISKERNEPPDIDVDFEHERREEVIQYLYAKYGRERAALAATVICYRGKSAVRDVAKALGLPPDQVDQLARVFAWWDGEADMSERLRERGFDPMSPILRRVISVTAELLDAPRHLSQHVGGFVISEQPLHHLVPVENAAMPDRTIIQWDKDDLDVLGLLKVDVLALGMLTCVRKTLDLLRTHRSQDYTPATIPAEDPATYAMIQRGDVIGVFQVESRAQMAMLPRLKPACFYDLVIEVAIVRPGPIQGGMVHPYLRRRQGLDPVDYPSEELRPVFEHTLGIPLFQEQVMQLAITAAEYTPGEADQLRRAMAAWKRHGGMGPHHERLVTRMVERGYTTEYAERIFEQIKGFGSYGFPESHAASFALITYVSCWLKCHEPAAFSCALLNSLPMGFYQPPQLVADARRHGIDVRPVDVRYSHWDCTLEPCADDAARQPALRLGMRLVRGMREEAARRIGIARAQAPFRDLDDLAFRAELDRATLGQLAEAAALRGLAGHRHRARWSTAGTEQQLPLFAGTQGVAESRIAIPPPSTVENTRADYASTGLTLGAHPVALIRRQLSQRRYRRSTELATLPNGRNARFAGIVILRQRPQTASGVTFLTLEDEAGMVNVVVWQQVAERQRRVFLESQLLAVEGRMESADGSQHLIATRLENLSPLLAGLSTNSRDFR